MHESGMNWDNVPPQQPPVERQRAVIKTKTIGNAGSEAPSPDSFRAKLEAQTRKNAEKDQDKPADKAQDAMIDRAAEMRHLKYDVIDEAAIVQVSVIKSEDGTVVRKVPPDKVVELVEQIRRHKKRTDGKFDIKL